MLAKLAFSSFHQAFHLSHFYEKPSSAGYLLSRVCGPSTGIIVLITCYCLSFLLRNYLFPAILDTVTTLQCWISSEIPTGECICLPKWSTSKKEICYCCYCLDRVSRSQPAFFICMLCSQEWPWTPDPLTPENNSLPSPGLCRHMQHSLYKHILF